MGRAGLVDLMIQHQPAQKGPLVMPGEIIFELSASPSGVVKPSTETNQTTDHSTIRGSNGSRASGEAVPARALTTVEQQTPLYLPQPPSPVAVSTGNKRRKTGTNNREPQKRYIAKQEAKKQETELLLRKLSEDIESVRVENAQLNSTNDVLQKALSVRDDHIKILEYTKDNKIDPTSTSIFVTARAPPLTPQWNSPGTAHQVDCSQNPIQKASCMAAAAFASGPSKSKGEQLKNGQEPPCPITNLSRHEIHAIRGASIEAVQAKYSSLCTLLSSALRDRENEDSPQDVKDRADKRMAAILHDLGIFCFDSAVLKPTAFQKILIAGVADNELKVDSEKWVKVQANLDMKIAQMEEMQSPRAAFLQKARLIAEERGALLTYLKENLVGSPSKSRSTSPAINPLINNDGFPAATGAGVLGGNNGIGGSGFGSPLSLSCGSELDAMHTATTYWITIHEKSQALKANLMEEHLACMELVAKCFGEVLTPLQKAKAIVASYPAFPDVFAIATAAAAELQRQKKIHSSSTGNLSAVGLDSAAFAGGEIQKTTPASGAAALTTSISNVDASLNTTDTGDDNKNTIQNASSSLELFGARVLFKE